LENNDITNDLNDIKNVVNLSQEKIRDVYININKKYKRNNLTNQHTHEKIYIEKSIDKFNVDITSTQFLLAYDIINNIIVILNNETLLDSSITFPILNMFDSFDNFYTDEDKIKLGPFLKSVYKLFNLNGWTTSGFNTSPNRSILALGLMQILNRCE